LFALRTLPALPDDDAVKAELLPKVNRHPAVVEARQQLAQAQARWQAVQGPDATTWTRGVARQAVEGWQRQLREAFVQARVVILGGTMPDDAAGGWPWRGEGAPWLRRETLLQGLPAWKHSTILEALQRLEAERLVVGAAGVPARKAWALRVTEAGDAELGGDTSQAAKLAELVDLLQRRPELVAVVEDALADMDGAEQ
jgi:hypothetical protein